MMSLARRRRRRRPRNNRAAEEDSTLAFIKGMRGQVRYQAEEGFMTVKQAANRIGISPSLIYALCHEGILRHTRHGRPGRRGTIRISEDAVREYLVACEHDAPVEQEEVSLKYIQ